LLKPGGLVVVEHSDRQGATAPAVFDHPGWSDVQDHRDLTGRDRFVSARATGNGPR
jgi:release factor glutamine methyltransferase